MSGIGGTFSRAPIYTQMTPARSVTLYTLACTFWRKSCSGVRFGMSMQLPSASYFQP